MLASGLSDEAADKAVIPSLDLAAKISQERRLWKAPALYDAIVAAARCAAKVCWQYICPSQSSAGSLTLCRVDDSCCKALLG